MNTIISILQTIWEFYVIGSVIFTTCFIWGLHKYISEKNNDGIDSKQSEMKYLKDNAIAVYLQEINNCFYLYEYATNNFIAQGLTQEEMWLNAKKKFPTKDFVIEGPDGKAILVTNIK